MKRNRIFIGLGVLVVLLVALWVSSREPKAERFVSPFEKVKMEDVDTLQIQRAEDDRPTLMKKQGEHWRVVEPVEGPADDRAVKNALEKIRDLEIVDVASESKDAQATLEVDEEHAVLEVPREPAAPRREQAQGLTPSRRRICPDQGGRTRRRTSERSRRRRRRKPDPARGPPAAPAPDARAAADERLAGQLTTVGAAWSWQSQLFAEITTRPGTLAPCRCASSPARCGGSSPQDRRVQPGGRSRKPVERRPDRRRTDDLTK